MAHFKLKEVFYYLLLFTFYTVSAKRYFVDLESVQVCANNSQQESPFENVKYSRINRTHHSLSGKYTFHRVIDEHTATALLLERWGSSGWVSMPFMPFQPDPCRYLMKFMRGMWVSFQKALGTKEPEKCPLPIGKYELKNYIVEMTEFKIPFWGGRFRFTSLLKTADLKTDIFCAIFIVRSTEIV